MAKRSLFLLFLVSLAVFPVAGGAREADGTPESLRRGVELYRAGQPEEALSRLRGFVLRHPGSPLLPEAYLYLARIFLDAGRPADALAYLERIPADLNLPEARLLAGAARIGTGDVERGAELLVGLEEGKLADVDRRLRFMALAEGYAGLGRSLSALHFLQQALSVPTAGGGEKLLQEAHLLLRDRLTDAELAEAAFMFAGTPLGEDARLQMAVRAFSRGEMARARELVEGVAQSGISFPFQQDAVLLRERLSGRDWLDRSIGVLLPQTGRFAAFGELVRRGMELARQVHSDSGVRLVFVDASEPEKTAAAVSALANEQRVIAIAGPITGAAAAAAAARAQEERVPILTLSQKEGLAETGSYVFRDSLTSRLQVLSLLQFAMEERGFATFAVLYPDNKLGKEMSDLFAGELKKRGGRLVAQQSYAETDTDFRVQIRRLQGRDPSEAEASGQTVAASAPTPFQALFIPDDASRVGLILPQLDYYGLHDVQLLGSSGWNSPELSRLAGSSADGAVFVDAFFRFSPFPFVQEFVNLYFEKYGEEPTLLEAQGFDAASILLTLLADPKIRTREDLQAALARVTNFPGVTGATTFDQAGNAEKFLFILQVDNGNIVQVN